MNFKYFKVTEQSVLDHIEECILSIIARREALDKLAEQFGSYECLLFTGGDIAAFKFKYAEQPDRKIWKKTKYGFMPKVKTEEYKLICAAPVAIDHQETVKKYGFGHEMILGDQVSGGGFSMHSSHIRGNRKTNFYVVVVPYTDKFEREVDKSLFEIKVLEMLKGMYTTEAAKQ